MSTRYDDCIRGYDSNDPLVQQFEAMQQEPCRRCSHPYADHRTVTVACGVAGCACHCFWEQPA